MCLTTRSTIRVGCTLMKNTRCSLLVSLSGRLTKLRLHGTDKKLAPALKQFVGPMTFCSLRPRKRNTKPPKGAFSLNAHTTADC